MAKSANAKTVAAPTQKGPTKATGKPAALLTEGKSPKPQLELIDKETGEITNRVPSTALAVTEVDLQEDSGSGMEGATQDSFAIPFLVVLQKGSPQVDEASGVALEGARQGMLYETVSGKMVDGKEKGVLFVQAAYKRVFIRWGARDAGGGFKGEFTEAQIVAMRTKGEIKELENRLYVPEADGSVNPKKSDHINDTRNHYGLILDETGGFTQAMISLTSTQIKKSKGLMSALAGVKLPGKQGMFTPATWASAIRVTTVPESNEKGSWMGIRFELAGKVVRKDIYEAGKQFNASVKKGIVESRYEDIQSEANSSTSNGEAGGVKEDGAELAAANKF